MWSQPRSALVGSLKAQHVGNGSTVNAFSSRFSPTVNGPSSVPLSPQTRIGSQLFRCPLPRVCVAVSSTVLAIIVHLALRRGLQMRTELFW